ncbi:MAG: hypothetical protein ACRD15_14800 [Vicinamibacterales bacterium]
MPRVGLELNYIWRKYDRFSWSPRSNFGSSDFSAVSVNPSNCSAQADCGSITYFVATSPQPSPYTATNQPDRHRDYNGLELSLTKRYSSRWLGTASFAYNDAQDYLGLGGSLPGPTNIHR